MVQEMSFKENVYGQTDDGNKTFGSGELKTTAVATSK